MNRHPVPTQTKNDIYHPLVPLHTHLLPEKHLEEVVLPEVGPQAWLLRKISEARSSCTVGSDSLP